MLNIKMAPDKIRSESIVHHLLNNHLQNSGKLFRPQLTIKLSSLLNLDEESCQSICWASELIHNASLIHDDVVDSARLRRDKPTLNSIVSNSKAVLAGDYLLASVIAELVRLKKYEILKTLSETLEDIVAGEFEQDTLKEKNFVLWADLESVALKKTGALFAWNCHSVALSRQLSLESQNICKDIGLKLGLAFQLIDDLLDYSHETGKEFSKDLKEGLINFTTFNLITLYPNLTESIYKIRGTHFEVAPWNEQQLKNAKEKTIDQANNEFEKIFNLIDRLIQRENISKENEHYQNLIQFLKNLQTRAK
jgi:geranylgeranyl pyrophosphate synthase